LYAKINPLKSNFMALKQSVKTKRVLFYVRVLLDRNIRTDVAYRTVAEWFNISEIYVDQIVRRLNSRDMSDITWPYEEIDLKVIDMLIKLIIKSK